MRVAAPAAVAPARAARRIAPSHRAARSRCGVSAAGTSTSGDSGWLVYVLKTPLIGLEAAGTLLGGAYPAALEHAVALIVAPDGTVRYSL